MKSMHKPTRECISCGQKYPKAELFRIVKNSLGIVYDATGKQDGRGAYLCQNPACREKLLKQRRLNKAFKMPVPEETYQSVLQAIESAAGQSGRPAE